LLVIGFVAGFASGAFGIGGGVVMVPALVLICRYEIKKAIGISLATIVPTALVGALTHYLICSSNIEFPVVLLVSPGAIAGAWVGARLGNRLSSRLLSGLFALFLTFVGLKLMGIVRLPISVLSSTAVHPGLVLLGLAAGVCSALLGIGGGVVMVPFLNLLFGLGIHEAIATSLTIVVPTTFAGAVFHRRLNNLDAGPLKYLVPAAFLGVILGAVTANCLSQEVLKVAFGVLMVLCSVKLFLEKKHL